MKILIIEPFFTGSHKNWAEAYQENSQHNVEILSLKGRHWKWRMYGGAVQLAEKYSKMSFEADLILATDMLDLSTFVGLSRHKLKDKKIVLYFHENQLTYPWSPDDEDIALGRDRHYAFINYTSALVADTVFFNSNYHLNSFYTALPIFLKQFPDYRQLENANLLQQKSSVLYLGVGLKQFDTFAFSNNNKIPIVLWNHRWEYDKNPEQFFQTLFRLEKEGVDFKLIVLGKAYQKVPAIFDEAKKKLAKQIIHFGYCSSFEEYAKYLWQADILPVTNIQDFFGGSIVEAIYCNTFPLLPKRLAYPEHIPKEWQNQCFYDTSDDFYPILKTILQNFKTNKKQISTQNFVKHYDWSILAIKYDQILLNQLDQMK